MTTGRALLLEGIHSDADAVLEAAGVSVTHETGALTTEALDEALDGVTVLGVRSKSRLSDRPSRPAPGPSGRRMLLHRDGPAGSP